MQNHPVLESALKLPMAERYQLVEAILDSMNTPNPQVDQAWAAVADARVAAFRRGETVAVPATDLIDQHAAVAAFKAHAMIGIWADRTDMSDVPGHVRNLRSPRLNADGSQRKSTP